MQSLAFEPTVDATLECSPRAPGEARLALDQLAHALDPSALRDAKLVVSELVTNSVRHSGSDEPIRLRAWSRPGGVKFEIADGGVGFEPAGRARAPDSEGGRGLRILDALADRWGVTRDVQTRVWFDMRFGRVQRERAQTG